LVGGWNPWDKPYYAKDCVNDVWNTHDGRDWQLVRPNTFATPAFDPKREWEGRHTAGYVVHDDRMWVLGGDPIQGHYQPDVWTSADGANWQCVCSAAPWGMRVLHHTVRHAGKIWVMGGQTLPPFVAGPETFHNDVWCTDDGREWTQILGNAPWAPRGLIGGSAVLNGRMWLIGGGIYETPSRPYSAYGEVWSSADGANWELHAKDVPWRPRVYHDVAAFDGNLWLLEGQHVPGGNGNDVWFSADGTNWQELPGTPWAKRHASSIFVFQDALWVVAGRNMQSDVWKLVRA